MYKFQKNYFIELDGKKFIYYVQFDDYDEITSLVQQKIKPCNNHE